MKYLTTLLIAILIAGCAQQEKESTAAETTPPDFYYGSWALDLEYDNFKSGWLEVTQEDGYIDSKLLWRWGSVVPVEYVFIADGELTVTRGRDIVRGVDTNGNPIRKHHAISLFKMNKSGEDEISGMAYFPGKDGITIEKVPFSGKRIPESPKPDLSKEKYGEPRSLIKENSLDGWELLDKEAKNGWSIKNGVLTNNPTDADGQHHGNFGNLRTVDTFEDFNLTLEVNVPEGSNSGVYLRGIYEIQVVDSYGKEPDSHYMGALYTRITPGVSAEKPAGQWQTMDITLCQRHVTVILNGVNIIDNQPVKGITGGAMTSDEFIPGPIYLQGDHGKVSYRNIVIKEIKK